MTIQLQCFIKNETTNLIIFYDTNEHILVVGKSDCQNDVIGNGYFIVQKEEWLYEHDGFNSFHPFLTKKMTEIEYPCS